jgi:Ca2+-binding RTX toxin-like protein
VTHSPDALEAFSYITSQSPGMLAAFETQQNFDITPMLPDGHHLLNSEIQFAPIAGGSVTAKTPDALLIGGAGNAILSGGDGVAILYGGGGNDTLNGGNGMIYLFGGSGNDRLVAGSGGNYMKGGPGTDVFVFTQSGSGHDTIADFNPGIDDIEIHANGSSTTTVAGLIQGAISDAAGDAVLHLGQHDIVLDGITTAQLKSDWFVLFH